MAVAQVAELLPSNWKGGGLIPGSSSPHVEVFLVKILIARLFQMHVIEYVGVSCASMYVLM